MDKIIIEGNNHLEGTVKISGAKNAVLPIMTAALMVDGKSIISKVPNLRDTRTMIKLLTIVGADCSLEGDLLTIDGSKANNPEAPYDLVKTMRASFYVLGPLLARFGYVKVYLPGGCAWGPRPVDYHLKGLEKLGAKITLESGYILAEANQLIGADINFEYPSVGATGNIEGSTGESVFFDSPPPPLSTGTPLIEIISSYLILGLGPFLIEKCKVLSRPYVFGTSANSSGVNS